MKKLLLKLKHYFSFVKIDYSFLILLFLFFLLDNVKMFIYYFIFIIIHELSHLIVAKHLGYLPKCLKITAFGASLEGFDDFLLRDEIKIVIAGPLFNLCVTIVCYLCFWFYPETFSILNDILIVNQTLFLFNILPIFPLDAGRLLLCFVSRKKGRREAVKFVKKFSFIFIIIMFFISMFSFFFYFNFSLGFVALNLCLLLFDSSSGTSFKREILFQKKISRLNKGISQKILYIKKGYSENLLLKFIDGEHYFIFIFVDDSFREIGRIDEYNLLLNLGFI